MAPWTPNMPWPSGTPGGAASPAWGGYTRLWARAAIGAGNTFHVGQSDTDRLDDGNVMGGGVPGPPGTLWVDLSCDVLDLAVQGGASSAQGIFSKPDAATVEVTLSDPAGIYDPLNTGGPFSYGGRSRLVPGVPVEVFAEVVNGSDGTWTKYVLFTGTADSWAEDWTPNPYDRQAVMVATDATKNFVRMDRPEQAPVGAGDTVQQRVHRVVDYFGWTGTVIDPAGGSPRTLSATTLADSAWEMLNRTLDDELGYIYVTPAGALRWLNRETWATVPPPKVTFGCSTGYDVLTDASPSALDRQMRNAVNAARAGGTTQSALSQVSIDRYGRYEYTRTDLGLADDTQVGTWATDVVTVYAYPQVTLDDVTFQPAILGHWAVWNDTLATQPVSDVVRINWSAPDLPEHVVDNYSRMVGYHHQITRDRWEITWQLIAARAMQYAGVIFHMGPHANDRLDANFVLALAA
jgi:hypothetical protein